MENFVDELSSMIKLGQTASQKINQIEEKLDLVETRLADYESKGRLDEGWMTLSFAATRCGLTQPALRQRIKNAKYPEGIVWKQRDELGAIFVNLKNLREHL